MPARVRGLEAEAGGGRPSTSRPGPAGINQCSTPPGLAGTTPSGLPAPQHQHPCAPGALSVLTSLCNLWPAHGNPPPRLLYLIFCLLPARSLPSTPRLTTSAPRHTTPSPIRTTLRTIPHHACRHLPIYHCLARLCNRIASLSTSGPRTPPPSSSSARLICPACCCLLLARPIIADTRTSASNKTGPFCIDCDQEPAPGVTRRTSLLCICSPAPVAPPLANPLCNLHL